MNRRELIGFAAASALGATAASAQPKPRKLHLDAYSRTLHWLRTPEDLAKACLEIGNTTIDLTVRTYPGHVDPAKVRTDLPDFVARLKRNGVTVSCMAAEITDANTPNVEALLDTAASCGIHHTWWRGFSVDNAQPYAPQIDAIKPRVAGLAKLNEKYGVKALYHPMGTFSSAFYDLLEVCRDFDPRYISIHYDSGNLGQVNQQNLVTQLRMGGPYIGAFVFKDFVVEQVPVAAKTAVTPPAAGPRGVSAGNGWRTRQVPIGTGILNLQVIARTLKDIGFQGPMECQPEWPELGGADRGLETLSISREKCIGLLKRDRMTVEAVLGAEGLI